MAITSTWERTAAAWRSLTSTVGNAECRACRMFGILPGSPMPRSRSPSIGFRCRRRMYPRGTRGLHEIKAIWENSTKHVQTESIYNAREAQAAIEMAA